MEYYNYLNDSAFSEIVKSENTYLDLLLDEFRVSNKNDGVSEELISARNFSMYIRLYNQNDIDYIKLEEYLENYNTKEFHDLMDSEAFGYVLSEANYFKSLNPKIDSYLDLLKHDILERHEHFEVRHLRGENLKLNKSYFSLITHKMQKEVENIAVDIYFRKFAINMFHYIKFNKIIDTNGI